MRQLRYQQDNKNAFHELNIGLLMIMVQSSLNEVTLQPPMHSNLQQTNNNIISNLFPYYNIKNNLHFLKLFLTVENVILSSHQNHLLKNSWMCYIITILSHLKAFNLACFQLMILFLVVHIYNTYARTHFTIKYAAFKEITPFLNFPLMFFLSHFRIKRWTSTARSTARFSLVVFISLLQQHETCVQLPINTVRHHIIVMSEQAECNSNALLFSSVFYVWIP